MKSMTNANFADLTEQELANIDGGFLPFIAGAVAVVGWLKICYEAGKVSKKFF